MDVVRCAVCWNSGLHEAVEEETQIYNSYAQIVGLQLQEDASMCYICRHRLLKLDSFRRQCVESHFRMRCYDDGEKPLLGTQYLHGFGKTNTLEDSICSHSECTKDNSGLAIDTTADALYTESKDKIEDIINAKIESLYTDDEKEYGCVISVTTHSLDRNLEDIDHNDSDNVSLHSASEHNEEVCNNQVEELTVDLDAASVENDSDLEGETRLKDSDNEEPRFKKIVLSIEEQKAELEAQRKTPKYLQADFKCYNCALGFLLKDSYQSHMVRHEESNGQYSCHICGLRFARVGVRGMHAALHSERHRCSRCGLHVRRARRRQHAARCRRSEGAGCHECGKIFIDTERLQQHLRRMHAARRSNKAYTCVVCSKVYRDSSALRVHTISKHSNRRFHCERCPTSFNNPYALNRHVAAAHGDNLQAYCAPCDAWFKSQKTYRAHVRTASCHRPDSYECSICGRSCVSKRSLESHTQARHSRDAAHACSVCGARFTLRQALLRHARTHSDRPPADVAVCHVCGKNFKGKNKLTRHLKTVCELKNLNEDADE